MIYSNFASENDIENWGIQGQVDYDFGNVKLTSITGYRGVRAITNQDSDFTSADLIRRPEDVDIKTFTQELRLDMDLGDSLKGMLGAFYFNEKVKQDGGLFFGSDFRGYADRLIRGQSANAFNVAAVEGLLGALQGNPALYAGKFFGTGTGLDESYRLKNTAFSVYGQIDFEVTDRLTLTGGLNYTKDKKRFSTNTVSNEVFSAIPLRNFVTPATQLFVAQGVGTAINSVAPARSLPASPVRRRSPRLPAERHRLAARLRPPLTTRSSCRLRLRLRPSCWRCARCNSCRLTRTCRTWPKTGGSATATSPSRFRRATR